MEHFDVLIIGAGAAGISAAKAAAASGRTVALVDRRESMGGILRQCTHRGFGDHLTGPEYIRYLLNAFPENVIFHQNTTVLSVEKEKFVRLCGGRQLSFDHLVLATGCREIPAGALPIAGSRPKGVYTAGQMQEMMNLHGCIPAGPVVILGGGDIGLILAAQLNLAGLPVTLVEKQGEITGMARNQRFLRSADIPVYLNDTITNLHGEKHLEGVTLQSGAHLSCRTLLIAVGLRPEQELVRNLGDPDWLTLCGNCRKIQPMVEAVVADGKQAGRSAADIGR